MVAQAVPAVPRTLKGHAKPRIAPPIPARAGVADFRKAAVGMGITLMPWQETAARYLTATDPKGRHLYREVCIVVARQNGKTTLMKPLIVEALRAGKRIMHIAQTRELPRQMFGVIADAMSAEPDLFPKRRGRTIWPRYGSGQEEVTLANGGVYRIAAANRGGSRGFANDLLVVDELREMVDFDILNAAEPTLTMSPDPQLIYLSNAGTEASVVLNAVRSRAGEDESLAYLEWSAGTDRPVDDREGWREANPAMGHYPQVLREIEISYNARRIEGTLAQFETERLCRWVTSLREHLVDADAWKACEAPTLEEPSARPYMAVSMDPSGKRASAALAWTQADDTIGLKLLFDVPGDPINTDRLGRDLRDETKRLRVGTVGFDPMTDTALTRYFPKTEPIAGLKYANASARFVSAVESDKLRWMDCDAVTDDLTWTARKAHEESGSFQAVRGNEDHPITASLAAIRAVWLASDPKVTFLHKPRIPVGF